MCSATTESVEAGAMDTFCHQLESILNSFPTSDAVKLMGDLNTKVGSYSSGDGRVV